MARSLTLGPALPAPAAGAALWQSANAIAVDATTGDIWVAGTTIGIDSDIDAFVARLDPASWTPRFVTNLGGALCDYASGLAPDARGNAWVVGVTHSADFPTTSDAWQPALGGRPDAFVAKVGPTGQLLYSSYLGGSGLDYAVSVAVDPGGDIYVAGGTASVAFPSGASSTSCGAPATSFLPSSVPQLTCGVGGGADAFVARLDPRGRPRFLTVVGGSGEDSALSVAVDAGGDTVVVGETWTADPDLAANDFYVLGPSQPDYGGGASDAFVVRLVPTGAPRFSRYLGGSGDDFAFAVALDATGAAYVAGDTYSQDFPLRGEVQPSFGGGADDAFVAKLSPQGALVWSTYLGGSGDDQAYGIALDANANVYVTGSTWSNNFPVVNGMPMAPGSDNDAFIAKLDSAGTRLVYSGYLGAGAEAGMAIAVDATGNAYVAGSWSDTARVVRLGSGGAGVTADPSILWPPNHRLVPVTVSVIGTAPEWATCTIVSISANETLRRGDWQITGDLTVTLRAERSGRGNGRVYTLEVSCTGSGDTFGTTTTVTVPHDRRAR